MEELKSMKDRLDTFLDSYNVSGAGFDIFGFISSHEGTDVVEMLPVHTAKVIGLIILACLCGIASLMLFITVCMDKCIRNQKMGFLLINMAVAVLLFDLAGILPRIETEITHMTSIGKIGCNFVYQLYHTSALEFALVLGLLGRDSAVFTYRPRSHSTKWTFVKYTFLTWAFSYICILIGFEVIGNGFVFIPHGDTNDQGACILKPFEYDMMTFCIYNFAIMYVVPAFLMALLTIFLIYLSYCRNIEASYKVNHMSFILSGAVFVIFSLPFYITFFYYENSDVSIFSVYRAKVKFVFSILKDFAKPLICVTWIFTVPELQRTFLRKKVETFDQVDDESITLIDKN